jgi:hypothetical protein
VGQHKDVGELGVIVHSGENRCNTPAPSPSPESLCGEVSAMPFPEWHSLCLEGHLLFSSSPTKGLWPEVGNGFIATVVQSDTIYAAGLFNGPDTDNTQRARIPAIDVVAGTKRGQTSTLFPVGRALDVYSAVFSQVSAITNSVKLVEHWYTPYHQPSLLVHEIELRNLGSNLTTISLSTTYPKGGESADLTLKTLIDDQTQLVVAGTNYMAARPFSKLTKVGFAVNKLPQSIVLPANSSMTLYSLTRYY